jgi:hypothetical protein
MRGCSFAENYITLTRMGLNNGTDTGTGNTADGEFVTDGNGYFVYDIVSQPSGFSVKTFFKASAVSLPLMVLPFGWMQQVFEPTTRTGFRSLLDVVWI